MKEGLCRSLIAKVSVEHCELKSVFDLDSKGHCSLCELKSMWDIEGKGQWRTF